MKSMFERLNNGDFGCADEQDAFEEFAFVYLRQTEQGDFCIDTDYENLLLLLITNISLANFSTKTTGLPVDTVCWR